MPLGSYPQPTRVVQHLYDKAAEWLERSYPIRDYPLNIRPVRRPSRIKRLTWDETTDTCRGCCLSRQLG
jgi:hypothetical protein